MTREDFLQELIDSTDNPELKARLKTKIFTLKEKKDPVDRVMDKIADLKTITKAMWGLDLNPIITFDLRGRAAGQFVRQGKIKKLRFNKPVLEKYTEKFVDRTVPHEWAHLVAREINKHRIKPHGKEWRTVCYMLGMEDVTIYHDYEVEPVRKVETFTYACGCSELHKLTKVRHNRALRGAVYKCSVCNQILVRVEND